MYSKLDEAKLHSGECLEVGVVVGPDPEWLPRLAPFLGHKPDQYRDHIRRALVGPLEELDTRFYVGLVNGRLISQIMVVGDRQAGIVGHVFTLPEERRKGACRAIMARQMDDIRRVGYRALGLDTGFETPPYWIYHSFGFRGVAPGNGCMRWFASAEAEAELYAAGATHTREGRWSDWGHVHLLSLRPLLPDEELPRSLTLGIKTQSSAEGPFLAFQLRREREPSAQALALVSKRGATVGWATLAPDPRWFRDHWLLDVDVHPAFPHGAAELLAALTWPDAPVCAYTSEPQGRKSDALKAAGFSTMATLPAWLTVDATRRDVAIWRKEP
jgi:hypothetical protein